MQKEFDSKGIDIGMRLVRFLIIFFLGLSGGVVIAFAILLILIRPPLSYAAESVRVRIAERHMVEAINLAHVNGDYQLPLADGDYLLSEMEEETLLNVLYGNNDSGRIYMVFEEMKPHEMAEKVEIVVMQNDAPSRITLLEGFGLTGMNVNDMFVFLRLNASLDYYAPAQ